MEPISAVVITHNEERNIERCLNSLGFCNEIIVLDSGSTDRTLELSRRYTDKVHSRPWTGYSDQKNYAVSLATSDWVLSVDADEAVSDALRLEIEEIQKKEIPWSAFRIPRRTFHSGRWIRYGGWYPNHLVRFFRKSRGKWVGDYVHERWETAGNLGELKGHLAHYSFHSFSDQVKRNDRYSTLGAEHLFKLGTRFSHLKLITKPFGKFVETYVIKLGFLDRMAGFFISISAAYSVFLKWAKLWELEKSEQK